MAPALELQDELTLTDSESEMSSATFGGHIQAKREEKRDLKAGRVETKYALSGIRECEVLGKRKRCYTKNVSSLTLYCEKTQNKIAHLSE